MKSLKGPSKLGKTKLVTTEFVVSFAPAFSPKYGIPSVIAYTQIPLWGVVLIALSIGVAWEFIETARYVFFFAFFSKFLLNKTISHVQVRRITTGKSLCEYGKSRSLQNAALSQAFAER